MVEPSTVLVKTTTSVVAEWVDVIRPVEEVFVALVLVVEVWEVLLSSEELVDESEELVSVSVFVFVSVGVAV